MYIAQSGVKKEQKNISIPQSAVFCMTNISVAITSVAICIYIITVVQEIPKNKL